MLVITRGYTAASVLEAKASSPATGGMDPSGSRKLNALTGEDF